MRQLSRTIAGLYDEEPIVRPVTRRMILKYGWDKSVFIQQVHYLTDENSKRAVLGSDSEGQMRYWVCSTYARWKEELLSSCEHTIRRMIRSLEKDGIIISKEGKSRTKYYTINYEKLHLSLSEQWKSDCPKTTDRVSKVDRHECPKWTDMSVQSGQLYNNMSIERENIERERKKESTKEKSLVPHLQEDAPSLTSRISNQVKERTRGTRLPEDWRLTDEQKERSIRAGMPKEVIENEIFEFKNFWEDASGKYAVKQNWWKTWQNKVKKYCEIRGISFDHSCFNGVLTPDSTSVTLIQKHDPSPPAHPESERFIARFKEKMETPGQSWEGYWDESFADSDMKLTSIGYGKAEIWVNTRSEASKLATWTLHYFMMVILNEIDPTMLVPLLDPDDGDYGSIYAIKRQFRYQ